MSQPQKSPRKRVTERESPVVRDIVRLALTGVSIGAIAEQMNLTDQEVIQYVKQGLHHSITTQLTKQEYLLLQLKRIDFLLHGCHSHVFDGVPAAGRLWLQAVSLAKEIATSEELEAVWNSESERTAQFFEFADEMIDQRHAS